MTTVEDTGVAFPTTSAGNRSTSALGRAVVTDALRAVDPAGALAAERETSWRRGYTTHFRRLTVSGLQSRDAATTIARDGLASLHRRMRVVTGDGQDHDLETLRTGTPSREPDTIRIDGQHPPEQELILPHRGEQLRGDALQRQLDTWVADGVILPSCAEAVRRTMSEPERLRLQDRTIVVLGAGAEMGPLGPLLRWGATVAGVDLPRPEIWRQVLATARDGAGTLLLPAAAATGGDAPTHERAGLDLIREVPAAATWVEGLDGRLVLGNYVYADGAAFVRAAVAVDVLGERVRSGRGEVALAVLNTPTDVFAVPREVVSRSVAAYEARPTWARALARPLRTISGGRLMRRAYVPDADPGVCDALVPQQGPNYALAKRLQRWRATAARAAGATVSHHVAPATATRSVVRNRALAAAYAGAHRFGVEIFQPETTNTLMAAVLVDDLHGGGPSSDNAHVWQDEAYAAAHGGLWTSAYAPPSVLGLAALLGLGAARS